MFPYNPLFLSPLHKITVTDIRTEGQKNPLIGARSSGLLKINSDGIGASARRYSGRRLGGRLLAMT